MLWIGSIYNQAEIMYTSLGEVPYSQNLSKDAAGLIGIWNNTKMEKNV